MTVIFPELRELDVDRDPLKQFGRWFEEASTAMPLAEAAALATADDAGRPSLRMVLIKGWNAQGFDFCSNYQSRKGEELAANSSAAMLFYWPALGRQVRLEGSVEQLSETESDRYFANRPRASQLSAVASAQSQTIGGRDELDERVSALERSLAGRPVVRPTWWGGYRLQPGCYEFWQHRDDRRHDRLRYLPEGSGWRMDRLQP
ncbi:MAG TPA: pyridoxamine 5'-phosphate oxidase [Candidatus Dormibacteraeota bacterium]|nr:pyridoxamine 5'-phosphate oxidase [Candidatus Dormibacteraeota bacterium]